LPRFEWHIVCTGAPNSAQRSFARQAAIQGGNLVTVRILRSSAVFRRGALLALAVTLVPLPLLAADNATAVPAQSLKTSIATHAKREVLAAASKTQAHASAQTAARAQSNDPHGQGFFRSPTGIVCLAVIAAGTGYAFYSASHDRIHSVARQGQ
jgi:hypothetical protein